jgi:hypothetical protein
MGLFAHHASGYFELEILGHDLTPYTPLEHAVAFTVTGLVLLLMVYGVYALVRDLLRWRRPAAQL